MLAPNGVEHTLRERGPLSQLVCVKPLWLLQLKEETERVEAEEKEGRKKLKAKREHAQQWESTRESRVGTWRDFVTKKAPNKVQTVPSQS